VLGWGAVVLVVLWGLSLAWIVSYEVPWAEREDGGDWKTVGIGLRPRGALVVWCREPGHRGWVARDIHPVRRFYGRKEVDLPWRWRPNVERIRGRSFQWEGLTCDGIAAISIPLLPVSGAMAAGAAWMFSVHRRRSRTPRCTACGYERGGLADEALCPECGHSMP
jgi:hypothetical protein